MAKLAIYKFSNSTASGYVVPAGKYAIVKTAMFNGVTYVEINGTNIIYITNNVTEFGPIPLNAGDIINGKNGQGGITIAGFEYDL